MGRNCSGDREKLLKCEAEGREFPNILRSLERFIQTVQWKISTIFEKECFLTCFWKFLRSKTLEWLEFKLEKIVGV